MTDILHLKFQDITRPIALIDCRNLVEHFPLLFSGWQISELHENTDNPILSLRYQDAVYVLTAEWLTKPLKYKDRVDALCGFIARIVRAYINSNPGLLCLHAAAADFGGTLVVFPSVFRAGKSVLSACIASQDVSVYCDDVLPVSLETGICLAAGLAPRLRLPLPENLTDNTRKFISEWTALEGRKYLYLDLRDKQLATKGSTAEMGAVVLLQREEADHTVLEPVSKAEILRQVVWQNFAREAEAPNILARLEQMVDGVTRYRLRYHSPEDAVLMLKDTFGRGAQSSRGFNPAPLEISRKDSAVSMQVPPGCYLQAAGINEITVDGEIFLADSKGAAIHHLNPIGAAIWRLLVEPMTIDEIVDPLLCAYSDLGAKQIEADVAGLIKSLQAKRLVITEAN